MAFVIARMVHPASEREAFRWLPTNSAILELLDLERGRPLKLDKLYRMSDGLQRRQKAIADALFAQTRTVFAAAGAAIFYDLTNTHLTGSPASPLAQFGRSKQKRNDCPLVTLALATDSHGFPRRSKVLPGTVSEPATLIDALDRLATADDAAKPTVIIDAGMSSADNLAYRRRKGHHWITVNRSPLSMAQAAIMAQEPQTVLQTKAGYEVRSWTLETNANDVKLWIGSAARQQAEEAIIARKRQRMEKELTKLKEGLSQKNRMKSDDKVLEKIGR